MNTPLIFDIKRCSCEDGPGIRTTIFLKGCNLDCFWCHNPEGKHPYQETAFFAEKCISCGTCAVLPDAENCPAQARKIYGQKISSDELFAIISSDRDYYEATGGGVTFSGGECMLYPDFLFEMAGRCKDAGISVAIDTAGDVPWSGFEKILPLTDLFLYDVKCIDPKRHQSGTGRTNERILENLNRLIETGANIWIRTPLIPGFNDDEEKNRIIAFCRERGLKHELLAYHTFGESKQRALEAQPQNISTVSNEKDGMKNE